MDPKFQEELTDLLKQSREAEREDRNLAEALEPMVNMEGWQLYTTVLNRLIQSRADEILRPISSVDGAIALEHVKGAMRGLIMARDLPSLIISAMKTAVPATDGDVI